MEGRSERAHALFSRSISSAAVLVGTPFRIRALPPSTSQALRAAYIAVALHLCESLQKLEFSTSSPPTLATLCSELIYDGFHSGVSSSCSAPWRSKRFDPCFKLCPFVGNLRAKRSACIDEECCLLTTQVCSSPSLLLLATSPDSCWPLAPIEDGIFIASFRTRFRKEIIWGGKSKPVPIFPRCFDN